MSDEGDPPDVATRDPPGDRRGPALKLVVDTDVVAAAVLGEAGRADESRQVLARSTELFAPAHWKAEFANVVWKAVRSGSIAAELLDDFVSIADRLPIKSVDIGQLWRGAIGRAVATNHPVYDTLFAELAARQQTVVASYDQGLRRRFPSLVRSPASLLRAIARG